VVELGHFVKKIENRENVSVRCRRIENLKIKKLVLVFFSLFVIFVVELGHFVKKFLRCRRIENLKIKKLVFSVSFFSLFVIFVIELGHFVKKLKIVKTLA